MLNRIDSRHLITSLSHDLPLFGQELCDLIVKPMSKKTKSVIYLKFKIKNIL